MIEVQNTRHLVLLPVTARETMYEDLLLMSISAENDKIVSVRCKVTGEEIKDLITEQSLQNIHQNIFSNLTNKQ